MLQSMTGFGSSTLENECFRFSVDIKSINSKQFDFTLKLPAELKEIEIEIRQLVINELIRGKIDCSISIIPKNSENSGVHLNKELIKQYYSELNSISKELGAKDNLMSIVMQMPNVIEGKCLELDSELWSKIKETIIKACKSITISRTLEGEVLKKDFTLRIQLILKYLDEIEPLEAERINQIKSRLNKSITEYHEQIPACEQNRLEQEIIFYLEKLDFTEEKVRLRKHCSYFMETMNNEQNNGKKLNFISQEIGREINTLGSKASHAEIQKSVIKMKDELEKIKEQLSNIL